MISDRKKPSEGCGMIAIRPRPKNYMIISNHIRVRSFVLSGAPAAPEALTIQKHPANHDFDCGQVIALGPWL
jgi:hypothetical protein